MTNKKLTNMAKGTASSDAVTKNQLDIKLSLSGGLMIANLDMNSHRIYNVTQPNGDNQPATKIWSENKFLDKSSGVMAGPLNMSNNKITNLPMAAANGDAVDFEFLEKNGYTSTTGDLNTVNSKITNLADPQSDKAAISKQYLEKSHVKPSHYNNEFKYLMTNKLRRTDLQSDSCDITKIDNLMPQEDNYHQYNYKVLFTTIIKDQQGGYSYKMGINCYQLDRNKDYTLCIEILNLDYQLWHKSVATIDKTTSQGVSIAGFVVQTFSHWYTYNSGRVAYMYYIKIIVNFQKNCIKSALQSASLC